MARRASLAAGALLLVAVAGSPRAWAGTPDAPSPRPEASAAPGGSAAAPTPAPLPPRAIAAAPLPVDPCAATESANGSLVINSDIEASLGAGRAAATRWQDAASRCPSAATHFVLGAARGVVARQEHSLVFLQQSIASYRSALEAGPSPESRTIVEQRLREGQALLLAWRARSMLDEARSAALRDDGELALRRYDDYLAAAVGDPERTAVEKERAQFVERYHGDWKGQARGRRITGGLILGAGLVAAGVGGYLISDAISAAEKAKAAETLGRFESRLGNATYQYAGGIALVSVGAAAAIAGIVRLASGGKEPAHSLWMAPAPGGLLAGGTF